MNKHGGVALSIGLEIYRMILTVAVLLSLVFIIAAHYSAQVDTAEAQAFAYSQSVLYAKHGIMCYDEEIDRVYPNSVCYFKEQALNNILKFDDAEEVFSMKLTLNNRETGDEESIYLNKDWYDRLAPRASALFQSPVKRVESEHIVVYQHPSGVRYPAILKFDMLVPR